MKLGVPPGEFRLYVADVPMRHTLMIKGHRVHFESPYSDDEAMRTLRGLMARGRVTSSFASDLLRRLDEGNQLTRVQFSWVHKLVLDAEQHRRNRTPREITGQCRVPGSRRSSW
jgi:hypothetical protein